MITFERFNSNPLRTAINASLSGDNVIVAGVSGLRIVALQYVIVVAGAVTVSWEASGGAVHGGPMAFAANGGAAPPFNPLGHFATPRGEGLVLNLTAGVQVGGHLTYALVE